MGLIDVNAAVTAINGQNACAMHRHCCRCMLLVGNTELMLTKDRLARSQPN